MEQTSQDERVEMENVDDILSQPKGCVSKQMLVYLSVFFFVLFMNYQNSLVFFTGHSPPWKCATNRTSNFCQLNVNKTFGVNSELFHQRCHLVRSEWTFVTNKDYSFVTEFDLVCSKTTTAALIGAYIYLIQRDVIWCGELRWKKNDEEIDLKWLQIRRGHSFIM